MHDHQQHHHHQRQSSLSQNVNAIVCIAQYLSLIMTVYTRFPGTWGKRYNGGHMAVSWIVLFFFGPLFFREYDPRPMFYFWLFTTFLLVLHGMTRRSEEAKGYRCHSLYTGRSIFTRLAGSERTAKTMFEPIALIIAGLVVGRIIDSPPMCVYLIVAAIGLKLSTEWTAQVEAAQIQAAEDARHDAMWLQRELQQRWEE
jgi:hypothetical protein